MTEQRRLARYLVELRDRALRMVFEAERHGRLQWEANEILKAPSAFLAAELDGPKS